MKNISLTVSPYAQTLYPAPPMPVSAGAPAIPKQSYQVTLGAQFENEAEALKFTNKLINMLSGDAE